MVDDGPNRTEREGGYRELGTGRPMDGGAFSVAFVVVFVVTVFVVVVVGLSAASPLRRPRPVAGDTWPCRKRAMRLFLLLLFLLLSFFSQRFCMYRLLCVRG